jgi:D-alanine-D-alanine ligase
MKVGITYDLRTEYLAMGYTEEETAEFDKEDTIDAIEQALQQAGFETDRIGHARNLMGRLLQGEKWDLVFNICEGLYGDGRESLVPALLDSYRIPYVFSGPATLAVTLNKYMTKRLVRDAGIPTPDFRIIRHEENLSEPKPPFPLFVKPVSEGTGKGIDQHSIIKTEEEYRRVCTALLKKFGQPVLVEEYLPGREYTIGVIGNGRETFVPGVVEVVFHDERETVYSYDNKENWVGRLEYKKVTEDVFKACESLALKVWEVTEARDAGRIDVKADREGRVQFIEINPLAGINPHHSDLPILAGLYGMDYQALIGRIMKAAVERNFTG